MTSDDIACFYCTEYAQVVRDYPVNRASHDRTSLTPRCQLQWKYECGRCGEETHFNGVAWCPDCKTFTCVHCSDEFMHKEEFLIYDYYYIIPCHECGTVNPALDYAEYTGSHPVQTGALQTKKGVSVWVPSTKDVFETQEFSHRAWGIERIVSLRQLPFAK
jgi:transcription elongation factor Elf1